MVGAEFAVVCTAAVLLDVLPICVEPLKDETAKVPVNDLTDAIAFSSAVLCADVSVTVRFAVPFVQESPEMVNIVVLPFLIASELVYEASYTVTLRVMVTVALSAVTVLTLFNTAPPSVLTVELPEVP